MNPEQLLDHVAELLKTEQKTKTNRRGPENRLMKINPEQLLVSIEECIKERPDLDAKSWTICWHEGRLKCLPARAVKNDGNVFGTFSVQDLKSGLSLDQWASVARKITEFFERKK